MIAHRAGAHDGPENTLLALERAIGARADMAEIDVQRTKDGVVVVNHDADLMRMARDPRKIAADRLRRLCRRTARRRRRLRCRTNGGWPGSTSFSSGRTDASAWRSS